MKIGGVPEPFNAAFVLKTSDDASDDAKKLKASEDFEFVAYPGGTGAMCEALAEGACDVAMLLTEGAVFRAAVSKDVKILAEVVSSPLHWGIFSNAKSPATLESLKNRKSLKFAISRYGSGSHLMASVLALQNGVHVDALEFVVVGNISGAVEALPEDDDLLFLWERKMTYPYVEQGIFKMLGVLPTPWPSFVAAVPSQATAGDVAAARALVSSYLTRSADIKNAASSYVEAVNKEYGMAKDDVVPFFAETIFVAEEAPPNVDVLKSVFDTLQQVDKIPRTVTFNYDALVAK